MTWFVTRLPRPAAPVQLFCLPYAGAGAAAYRDWPRAAGRDVEVHAVQLPGRESRIAEDAAFSVPDLAAAIAARADRPYALYGHSMGGWIAFEVVRELRRTGAALPVRLFVGGCRAPHVPASGVFHGLSLVSDAELVDRLGAAGGLPAEVVADPELTQLLLPALRADFGWLDGYRYTPGEPIPVPLHAFQGSGDTAVTRAHTEGWRKHAAAGFTLDEIDGGHFFLRERPDELVGAIAAALRPEPAAARIRLGTTEWSVWPDAELRTAGFPAEGLSRFAAPETAAAADAVLDGDGDAELFGKQFDEALAAGDEHVAAIAADPAFREAVTWQNAELADRFAAGLSARSSTRRRQRTAVARYWQRYCGKNETIGFFGPELPVTIADSPTPVTVRPGPDLVRDRRVRFEWWALVALAEHLAADPAVRAGFAPRLAPHLVVRGRCVLRPARPELALAPADAAALALCDGRSGGEVAAALAADGVVRTPADGVLVLERLVEWEILTWDADLPAAPDAEEVLRDRIAGVADEAARASAQSTVDRLAAARDAVAAAAGDPDALRVALAALDAEFTAVTGQEPRRSGGQMYAGRTLVYEDTVRDLDVVFGAAVLDPIAEPLAVLLRAARWLTVALADAYTAELRGLYRELAAEGPVTLGDLWFLAQGMFWGDGPRPVDAVADAFVARWTRLFGLDQVEAGTTRLQLSSAELARAVAETFPATAPGWSAGRLHSPDLQICAGSVEDIERGDYTVVLGELHTAWASMDCPVFAGWHPDPGRLRDCLAEDLGGHRVRLLFPADWPRRTGRLGDTLTGPTDRQLAFAAAPGADRDRLLPAVAVAVLERDGELVAADPDGRERPLVEMFSALLSAHAVDGFKLVAAAPHTPRITVDTLVVARESWRTTIGGTGLAEVTGDRARYLAVRRMRRDLGLPERVFCKIGTETKPCFVDFTAPLYAVALCSMLRSAAASAGPDVPVGFSELLPSPEQAWVPDAAGARYGSELRMHVTDDAEVAW